MNQTETHHSTSASRATDKGMPVLEVIDKSKLEAMKRVGQELKIEVSVLADEGQEYEGLNRVRPGAVYVSIQGSSGKHNDLTEFWQKVAEESKNEG